VVAATQRSRGCRLRERAAVERRIAARQEFTRFVEGEGGWTSNRATGMGDLVFQLPLDRVFVAELLRQHGCRLIELGRSVRVHLGAVVLVVEYAIRLG
jgi:hypothetical protein